MSARARKTKSSTGPNVTSAVASSESSGLASKPASLKHMNLNPEEKRFQKELKALEADADSVSGREGKVIVADIDKLVETIENASITRDGKAILLAEAKRVKEDVESTDRMEAFCGKWLQRMVMFTSFFPMAVTFMGTMQEVVTRPKLVETNMPQIDLAGQRAVVTGGCGSLGLELAVLLAQRGAQVTIGCHETSSLSAGSSSSSAGGQPSLGAAAAARSAMEDDAAEDEFAEVPGSGAPHKLVGGLASTAWAQRQQQAQKREAAEAHLASLGLLKGATRSSSSSDSGWVETWPLELESFASVRHFAARVVQQEEGGGKSENEVNAGKLDLLVHAAATKEGCGVPTVDGHDVGIQVNYLAPVLLTHLLTPALERGRNTNFSAGEGAAILGSNQGNDDDDEFSGGSSGGSGGASGGALASAGAGRVVWVTCGAGLALPDWLPWPLTRTTPDTLPKLPFWHLAPGVHAPTSSTTTATAAATPAAGSEVKCPKGGPLSQFGDAKLAVAVYARELSRRYLARAQHLGSSVHSHGAVGSHAVDPGTLNNDFGRSASSPPPKQSMQGKVMSYLPPVWIAQKVGSWLKAKLNVADAWAAAVYRSPLHGALVALHVATHPSLGGGGAGGRAGGVGGIFSDAHGALWGGKCGTPKSANGVVEARECGRIPAAELPAAALNRTLSAALFDRTEELLRPFLEPLVPPPS